MRVITVIVKSCKEMGDATSAIPVIRDVFSQWADTIDWTVRCDSLQVISVVTCSLHVLAFNLYLASFILLILL